MEVESMYVPINPWWRVTANPEGGGLMLCVDRGINCEGHTQVLSYHLTNTPEIASVRAAVVELSQHINEEIDAFTVLMRAMGSAWEVKESIGLLFAHYVLKTVADAAEKKALP